MIQPKFPPKSTNVYPTAEAGLSDILDAAIGDEPPPTPRAADLIEEAEHAGPLSPLADSAHGLPTVTGTGGGDTHLAGVDPPMPPGPTHRESAENMIELAFALVPAGDWQPENQAEREELVRALERVFVYRNFTPSLPPELTLLAVAGKYTRRRMAKPAVAAKLTPWLKKIPLLGKLMGAKADETEEASASSGTVGPFATMPRMTPEAA